MTVKANQTPLRLGIDFGYGYTGVCLLDSDNSALGAAVVEHDTGLSKVLEDRRGIRAMRRRAKSRRRRLRDCYALLAEMDCAPAPFVKDTDKGGKAERKKELPANRLYALMHRRGWDSADVLKLLFDKKNNKPGRVVGEVDNLLIKAGAPASLRPKPTKKKPKETPAQFEKRQESYNLAVDAYHSGKLPERDDDPRWPEILRWLEIKEPCLGYLSDWAKQKRKLVKRLEKNPDDESEEELRSIRDELERKLESETEDWENAELGAMENKIGERIDAAFPGATNKKREELTDDIMVILGLVDSFRFKDGKEYRPSRNRHRTKMLDKLDKLFDKVAETPAAKKRAAEVAAREGREAGDVIASWKTQMEGIAKREYRKKRFLNRQPGKCPAKTGDGADEKRCGKNLPKRARVDIRKLLFETEARQMNIVVAKAKKGKKPETRKLSDEEIAELLDCVEWDAKGGKIKDTAWAGFFERNPPLSPKKDESGEEHRGKKDALLDIARGKQAGRTNLCTAHIAARLKLIRNGETESQEWANLHGERIIDQTDAPPSLRQKVDRVCAVTKQLIKKAGREGAPIVHIGIESARFDIHSLSARTDGRILKKNKASYSKSRGSDLPALIRAQDNRCLYCGEPLFLGINATVDHVFPKARRGGDAGLNRVAACKACNNNKWRSTMPVDENVLAALKAKHSDKVKHIKKWLEQQDDKLPPNNLAAPVQTMFGAKVLRGALAKAFEEELKDGEPILRRERGIPDKESVNPFQFPKIRAEDAADLRRSWFPFMARQKAALREAGRRCGSEATVLKKGDRSQQFIAYAGESFNLRLGAKKLKEKWKIVRPRPHSAECKSPFAANIRNGALVVSSSRKKLGDDDVGKFWLRINECERVFSLAKDEDEHEFNLGVVVTAKIDWEKSKGICAETTKIVGEGEIGAVVKTVTRKKLILRADKSKVKKREAVVKTDACYLPSIVVCPRRANKEARQSEDPIYKFHHIMDAAVVAANVDWEKIARLARDSKARDSWWRDVLAEEAPDLSVIFPPDQPREDGDFCAPLLGDWLILDRRDKSGPKAAKTKREPVRKADNRQVPLDCLERICKSKQPNKLTREDAKEKIVPDDVQYRDALLAAWEEIDAMPPDERKKFVADKDDKDKQIIKKKWFQELPQNHLLHWNKSSSPRIYVFCGPEIANGDEKIRDELVKAWKKIDGDLEKMNVDEQKTFRKKFLSGTGDKEVILGAWFLQLPAEHCLSPNRHGTPPSVRVIKPIISQRVPLDRITRKEIDRIAPGGEKIQAALEAAWVKIKRDLEGMDADEQKTFRKKFISGSGDNAVILGAWFLQLPPKDFLRPNRKGAPRSVRVKNHQQPAPFAIRQREHSVLARRTHRHYFEREDFWGSVVIFRADNGAETAIRRRPDFYVNRDNDEWEQMPPPDARQDRVFRRRDWVRVAAEGKDDLPGLWRLRNLNNEAEIEAADDEARTAGKESSQPGTFINHGYVRVDYCCLRRAKKPA